MGKGDYWAIACGVAAMVMSIIEVMYPQIPKVIGLSIVGILLVVCVILVYKGIRTRERVQLDERSYRIYRHDNENIIRLDAFVLVTIPYLSIECKAELKINHIIVSFLGVAIKQQEGTSSPSGTYHIMMQSDKYEGALSGKGLLQLTLSSNRKKIKKFTKMPVPLEIPAYESENKI